MQKVVIERLELRRLLNSYFGVQGIHQISESVDLATADINSDGIDDVVTMAPGGDRVLAIYLSSENGHTRTQEIVVQSTHRPLLADFDQDGDLDIAASRTGRIRFFDNVNSNFVENPSREILLTGLQTAMPINAVDVDGDLDIDIAVAGNWRTLVNDGAGTFHLSDAVFESGIASDSYATTLDIDQDGDDDVVSKSGMHQTAEFTIYRNDASGTLTRETLGIEPPTLRVLQEDVDLDGDRDLVYANGYTEPNYFFPGIRVALNDGAGNYPTTELYYGWNADSQVLSSTQPALADFNDDGYLDIFYAGENDIGNYTQTGLMVIQNNGDGSYGDVKMISGADSSIHLVAGDFDGDGIAQDLVYSASGVSSTYYQGSYVAFHLKPGIPNLQPQNAVDSLIDQNATQVADFDNNGITDFIFRDYETGSASLFLMNADGTFSVIQVTQTTPSLAIDDVNQDGLLDLIDCRVSDSQILEVVWWRNMSNAFGDPELLFSVPLNHISDASLRDLDGDGMLDLVHIDGLALSVWRQTAAGVFASEPLELQLDASAAPFRFVDFDRDGDLDVFGESRNLRLDWEPTPQYVALPLHATPVDHPAQILNDDWFYTGDLNNDGAEDLVVTSNKLQLLFNDGHGVFNQSGEIDFPTITEVSTLRIIDVDLDGDLDMTVIPRSEWAGGPDSTLFRILENDGTGNFSFRDPELLPLSPLAYGLGDMTGDQLPDLLVVGRVTNGSNFGISGLMLPNLIQVDAVAPTVSAIYLANLPATRFAFSENVFNSLDETDFELKRLENNSTIDPGQLDLEWDSSTNSVLVHYTGSPNGALPDGHYRFTIQSTDVNDASGNTLASDFTFNFNVYSGDIDGDGTVNFNDLLIIAQNYGSTNANFDQGDLDYDGDVDFEDLLLVAQRYGTSLPQLRPLQVTLNPLKSLRTR